MLSNPLYDPFLILSKVYSSGTHLKQAIADTYIEEQFRSRTVKIVYGVLEKDGYLEFCIKHYTEKSPKLAVRILLKICLYMLLYMDKKRYTVTDLAVTLCKKLGKGGVSGFVNAFLRRFNEEEVKKAIPKNDTGKAIQLSYPLFAYEMLKKEYNDRADAIASATAQGISVRFKNGEEAKPYLQKLHIKTPFSTTYHHYIFERFVRDEGYDEGKYTFQSVGSIAICDCVTACNRLLDACSAPGGKSVLLADKCEQITSFELHPHRVDLITQYKKRMQITNVTELQKDSAVFDEQYAQQFDGVLCDVPCSGYGTVTENPDIKLFRKQEDFSALRKMQLDILSTCKNYVKKGGALYYSTCSLFAYENDDIIETFLKNNPDFTVENLSSPLPHDKKKFGLQFLPDISYGVGFYVCKMIRKNQ